EDSDIPEYGIPAHLMDSDPFRTRMLHIQLRTLLMRCISVQSYIRGLEHRPWMKDAQRPVYWHYSKIRNFAQKARRIAEALESRDLRARCEYWTGRGCGGTRDYHAAKEHFALAVKLDVENDKHPSGRVRLRGLRPDEKTDVHFLLDSVTDRYERSEIKIINARNIARYESATYGKPAEDYINWTGLESPPWLPDHDRVVQNARQDFVIKKMLGRRANLLDHMKRARLGQEAEGKLLQQMNMEGIDEIEIARRLLNKEEWHYIHHGDQQAVERRAKR
ncbi:hypothetical protein EK21DRAFT_33344, partial [Setomelanomma holmii]